LHTDTALSPLPGGSTNVYSQTLGYPRHADDAARALLGALERDAVKRVSVGMTNDRAFLFCTGIGFDASVIRRVERHSRRLKRMASHPLHIAAAFHTFVSADGRGVRVDLEIDRGTGRIESIRDVRFGIISKTSPYTHLGRLPIHVNRNANLDSRLSLTAFTQLRALSLIGGAFSAIRTGRFLHRRKDVVQLDDLAGLHVRSEAPFPYQVDGDDVGDTDELRIRLEAAALTVALPPRPRRRGRS
jgi:diacylglycerol kinase family enzyme